MPPSASKRKPLKYGENSNMSSKKEVAPVNQTIQLKATTPSTNQRNLRKIDSIFQKRIIMVLVHMESCHFCNILKPSWSGFVEKNATTNNVDVVEMDVDTLHSVVPGQNAFVDRVKDDFKGGVPFIWLLHKNNEARQYMGDRSETDLSRFVSSELGRTRPTPPPKPKVTTVTKVTGLLNTGKKVKSTKGR